MNCSIWNSFELRRTVIDGDIIEGYPLLYIHKQGYPSRCIHLHGAPLGKNVNSDSEYAV